jgi:quercetin dioxygenase-like cupin family protein
MKRQIKNIGNYVACLALVGVALALRANGTEVSGSVLPIPIAAADLKWTDLDPSGAPGVKVADVWGDHKVGAFGAFFSLPPGFSAPLHTHTHDMKLVIVSGTYIQGPDGKAEFRLGAGSYLMQPGGNYRHTTSCDAAADCVFYVESDGAFDLQTVATETAVAPK